MGTTIQKGINLFKRVFGAGKSAKASEIMASKIEIPFNLIGEKNGIKVFKQVHPNGNIVIRSERLGHTYKTITKTAKTDVMGGAQLQKTTVFNHESGLELNIEKTYNRFIHGGQRMQIDGTCGKLYANFGVKDSGRYNIHTVNSNDPSPGMVRRAVHLVSRANGKTTSFVEKNCNDGYSVYRELATYPRS